MPAEVIDLLSSSEAPSSPKAANLRIASPSAPCDPSLKASSSTVATKRSSHILQRSQEILLYSDDFETTVDLSCDLDGEDRAVKRARVSGGSEAILVKPYSSTSVKVTAGTCANNQHTARHRNASALDPIEFTSSPDPVLVRNKGKSRATVLPDDDDPFASSPQMVQRKENIKPSKASSKEISAPLLSDFQDPFASSSPLNPSKSPPTKAAPRSPRKPTAWDPISSSMPEVSFGPGESILSSPVLLPTSRKLTKAQSEVINLLDSEGDSFVSLASDDSLPDVRDIATKVKAGLNAKYSLGKGGRAHGRKTSKSPPKIRSAATKSKSGRTMAENSATIESGMTVAEKALEKQEKAAARKAESARKRLEMEQTRVEKKLEKERAKALAEVNKIRTDKKQSTPEMIVDLPSGLNPRIRLQAETLLRDLHVDFSTYSSPINNIVRWRRKVAAVYNAEAEQWEPVPLRLVKEEHVMVLMPAAEFVELARCDAGDQVADPDEDADNDCLETSTLEDHVSRMQTHFPDSKFIYLIEGMSKWMRSNRTIQNRQFAAGVRSLAGQVSSSSTPAEVSRGSHRRRKPAKKKKTPVYVEEDVIEDALMRLQVIHSALIYHVDTELETAQWISVFTQHISTIPYRRTRDATNDRAAFCMDTGQVRTGDDAGDAYVRMLQQLTRVTPAIAYGIAAEYPTVSQLVGGFESRGPLMLEGCRKSTNKDGAFSDRTIGQALSRRLYKVFTGRDEASTDV